MWTKEGWFLPHTLIMRPLFWGGKARKQPHPSAADRVRGGGTATQIHMQVGPHSNRCCRKGPQGATPRTRPPAPLPLGRRPQAAWSVHCTTRRPRTLVPAPSIKRISSSNPEGPLRDGCRRPAPPSTSGLFYPDARLSWLLQPREIQHRRALHNVQHGLPRGPGEAWCSRLPGGVQCQGGHHSSSP